MSRLFLDVVAGDLRLGDSRWAAVVDSIVRRASWTSGVRVNIHVPVQQLNDPRDDVFDVWVRILPGISRLHRRSWFRLRSRSRSQL